MVATGRWNPRSVGSSRGKGSGRTWECARFTLRSLAYFTLLEGNSAEYHSHEGSRTLTTFIWNMADLPDHHRWTLTSLRAGITSTFDLSECQRHAGSALAATGFAVQQKAQRAFSSATKLPTSRSRGPASPSRFTRRQDLALDYRDSVYICPPCCFTLTLLTHTGRYPIPPSLNRFSYRC